MSALLRPALALSLLAVAACDEIAVANDPEALSDVRGQKSCLRAVSEQTGVKGVSVNTSIPVIETNRFIIDVPNAKSWVCITDENNRATQLAERNA